MKKIDKLTWGILAAAAGYFSLSTIPVAVEVHGLWAIVLIFGALCWVSIQNLLKV